MFSQLERVSAHLYYDTDLTDHEPCVRSMCVDSRKTDRGYTCECARDMAWSSLNDHGVLELTAADRNSGLYRQLTG